MKRIFTILFAAMLAGQVWATDYDFKIDNVCYSTWFGDAYVECENSSDDYANNYSGLTTVTIPDTIEYDGDKYPVIGISRSAFKNCSSLTSITLPNTIHNIREYAFEGCSSLESVVIPSSVTSLGENVFCNCTSLTSVTLPDTITYISAAAFGNCSSLTSIEIPNTVTFIGNSAFSGSGLTSIEIPKSVTEIASFAFKECDGLETITIPATVEKVQSWVFQGCDNLTVNCCATSIPAGWSTYWNDYNIPYNLVSCEEEKEWTVTLSASNSSYGSVSGGGTIADGSTVTITATPASGYKFVKWSNGLTSASATITVTSDTTLVAEFARIGEISSLHYEIINNNTVKVVKSDDYKELTEIVIPETVEIDGKTYTVTGIGDRAFQKCSNLITITIPNTITNIGVQAFEGCYHLTSVTIPNSVTDIGGYAFDGCSSMRSAIIGNSVRNISSGAFYDCINLTIVTIPKSATSIGKYAFTYCYELTIYCEVESQLEGWDEDWNSSNRPVVWGFDTNLKIYTVAVSSQNDDYGCVEGSGAVFGGSLATIAAKPAIGYRFVKWSNGLTNATVNLTVTSDTTLTAEFAQTGFTKNCYRFTSDSTVEIVNSDDYKNLTKIVIPDTVEHYGKKYAVTSIGGLAFVGCTSLTDVTIPNVVTTIGDLAFRSCSRLTTIVIPEGVTSIGKIAFGECYGLKSITIPSTVTSIGENAFSGCDSLTKAEFASIESLCGIDFANSSNPLGYAKHLYIDGEEVTDLVIPNTVTKIGQYTFQDYSSLTSVTIPESVTTIDDYAFCRCDSLKLVIVPASVTSIGFAAFDKRDLTFYCEAESQPEGWNESWNLNNASVIWNAGENLVIFKVLAAVDSSVYGSVEGGGTVVKGFTTKITATPAQGYHFTSWSDNNTDNPRTLTVTSDTSLTAFFEAHTVVTDSAFAATCTEKGKTEGSHCSVCGKVIVTQKTISALGHEFVNYIYNNDATTTADGTETAVCEHGCGETDTRVKEGTKLATAVTESAANAVNIYATGNKIVIENVTDEIFVYNAVGTLVCKEAIHRVSVTITVNNPGVYIVKTGSAVKRVIVN